MDCRVPAADGTQKFWDLLLTGQTVVGRIPPARERLTGSQFGDSAPWGWGGLLDGIEFFDEKLFGISPREAQSIDPQQRLLLEAAWRALESANIASDCLAGSMTGVFVGISWNDYFRLQADNAGAWDAHSGTGNALSVAANRISHCFDLRGPSMAIDTACSSSLVAVHQACVSLASGESNLALAGGVNLVLCPDVSEIYGKAQMLSPTGRCWTFDEKADGYVRGEGCGMVVLKRLSDARRDGDRVLAVIRGSAINQDGRTDGLSAPNSQAQRQVIRMAMERAGFSGTTIGYVETHGTGTPLGDSTETQALRAALDSQDDAHAAPCWLGAAKSVIGHLESAAGIVGLIKAVMVLQHGRIPPNANFSALNPKIGLGNRLRIPSQPMDWPASALHPRRAGVSSFGFGGLNASVMLEEAEAVTHQPEVDDEGGGDRFLLTLCARSEKSLRALAGSYGRLLESAVGQAETDAICRTANTSRAKLPERLAVSGGAIGIASALHAFSSGATGAPAAGLVRGWAGKRKPVVFLFSGQGAQYAGMGQGLYMAEPVFRACVDRCDAILEPLLGVSIRDVMFGAHVGLLDDTQYAQPALTTLELALAEQWRHWGVEPDIVIGHSIGEAAAACVAGIIDLETVLRVVVERGNLMSHTMGSGAMASVAAGIDDVQRLLGPALQTVCVAGINAPDQVVLSGDTQALDSVLDMLKRQGIESSLLKVGHAFHSNLMDSVLDDFQRVFRGVEFHTPGLTMITTGGQAGENATHASYWVNQLRQPVRFAQAMADAEALGAEIFVEIGPSSVLVNLGRRCVAQGWWLASLRRGEDDALQMRTSLGELFVQGVEVDFARLDGHRRFARAAVPVYPFDKSRYWFPRPAGDGRHRGRGAADMPLLGHRVELSLHDAYCFEVSLPSQETGFLFDHRLLGRSIMPAAGYIGLALAALRQTRLAPSWPATVTDLQFDRPLDLSDGGVRVQTAVQRGRSTAGDWQLRVCAWNETAARWETFAQGEFRQEGEGAAADIALMDHPSPSGGSWDAAGFYARCSAKGLEYGEAFQAIASLAADATVVHGEIQAPDAACCPLHPVVLDAAFQVLVGSIIDQAPEGRVPLPVSVERLTCHKEHHGNVRVTGRLRPAVIDGTALVADLVLTDEFGSPVAEVQGITMAWVDTDRIVPQADRGGPAGMFYLPAWSDEDAMVGGLPAPAEVAAKTGAESSVLCVYPEHAKAIKDAIVAHHGLEACSTVLLGQALRELGADDRSAWEIDAFDPNAFDGLMPRLRPFDTVYFLGSVQPLDLEPDDLAALDGAQEHGVMALFRLLQAMSRHGLRDCPVAIKSFSNGLFAVRPDEPVQAFGADVVGLVKAAAKEYGQWTFGHVDAGLRELKGTQAELAKLVATLASHEGGVHQPEMAVRAGRRLHPRLHPVSLPACTRDPFKPRGVYLIVGGVRGIGLELAAHLAQSAKARLALVGRSEPNSPTIAQALRRIEALGGEAVYLQADVVHLESIQGAVREAKARFGSLNGVVHAPLVLRDKALDGMDEAALRDVLAPKVVGSVNLCKALAGESLDFLLFFSSAMSFVGNAGLANYVAASTFEDAFARAVGQRVPYPVKTINWGPWSEVGAVSSHGHRTRFAGQGMDGISIREGLHAIRQVLDAGPRQLLAIKAGRGLLSEIGVDLQMHRTAHRAVHAPWLPGIATALAAVCQPALGPWADLAGATEAEALLSRLVLLRFFRENTASFSRSGQRCTPSHLRNELRLDARFLRWFDAALDIMSRAGWITVLEGDEILTTHLLDEAASQCLRLEALREQTVRRFPASQGAIDLLWTCGERYAEVLSGALPAMRVLFPEGAPPPAQAAYGDSACAYRSRLAAACVANCAAQRLSQLAPGDKLRILEIGAGRGGTTRHVLAALGSHAERLQYVYTDLSPTFVRHGEDRLAAEHGFLTFGLLDIERHPHPQGFEPASFDLVVATDVMHATTDIARALAHAKYMLKPNGALVLNEATARHDLYTLTFGLLDGWWLFSDSRRRISHTPLLDSEGWARQLGLQGFNAQVALGPQGQVRVAQSDGVVLDDGPGARSGADIAPKSEARMAPSAPLPTAQDLLQLAEPEVCREILRGLATMVGKVLRIDMASAFPDEERLAETQFSSLGIDSLMAMELRDGVRRWLAVPVAAQLFIGRSRVADIVDRIRAGLLVSGLIQSADASDSRPESREELVL